MNKLTLCFTLSLSISGLVVGCGAQTDEESTQSQALGHGAQDGEDNDHACRAAQHAAQASKPHKVTICHIPPGNPDNAHTINVSKNAVRAHLAHGDVLDGCGCSDDGDRPDDGDHSGPNDDAPTGGGDSPDGSDEPQDQDEPNQPPPQDQPDDGGSTGDGGGPTPTGSMCDADQLSCSQDAECGNNQACDATSHCCVDVFL